MHKWPSMSEPQETAEQPGVDSNESEPNRTFPVAPHVRALGTSSSSKDFVVAMCKEIKNVYRRNHPIQLDDLEYMQTSIQVEELQVEESLESFRMFDSIRKAYISDPCTESTGRGVPAGFSPRFPFAAESFQCKRCLLSRA